MPGIGFIKHKVSGSKDPVMTLTRNLDDRARLLKMLRKRRKLFASSGFMGGAFGSIWLKDGEELPDDMKKWKFWDGVSDPSLKK